MTFDIFNKTAFEKFTDFLKTTKDLKSIRNYYKENNLHKSIGEPVIYKFTGLNGKVYYGKANDCLKRLNNYVNLNNINEDLKIDIIRYGFDFFKYEIIQHYPSPTNPKTKITIENIFDAENYYTAAARLRNVELYNRTNFKQIKKPSKISKTKTTTVKNFDDFEDLIGKGFII